MVGDTVEKTSVYKRNVKKVVLFFRVVDSHHDASS
jgi:hypothetical protein